MKKINTHSYTKPDLIVGPFSVLLKILFGFVIVFAAGTLVPSQALAWDCTLSASPTTIQEGSSSTLAWTTINSTSFSIDNGVGSIASISSGTTSVSPTTTTTYTGTAHGPGGSITCKVTITVTPKPTPPAPTCTLSASSSSVSSSSSATLSWTTTNATSFSISNGVGVVTQTDSGSTSVSSAVTTYTGTASSSSSSVTCTVTVTVTPPPPPTCHTYSKNDGKITGSVDKGNATLTIPANVCPVEVSFSSYNLPDGKILPYSHQVLYDNITHTYGPGTHAIGPLKLACNWQTDLYLGGVQTTVGPSGTQGLIAYDDLTGQHCSPPPPPPAPTCTLSANPVTIQTGSSSTLSWTTTNATSFAIDNNVGTTTPVVGGATTTGAISANTTYTGTATGTGGSVTCSATVTVPPPVTGCTANCGGGGGGGGGGSSPSPSVLLTALPHVGSQPLAYLYLSQIPYTGLDLGPVGTIVYWAALIVFALVLAYLVLFGAVPFVNRSFQDFGSRVKEALNIQEPAYAGGHFASAVTAEPAPTPAKIQEQPYEAPRGYSSYEGFKSFAHNDSLSIDDIVKGLARSHSVPATVEPEIELSQKVEPVYENVEPIYKNIDTIMTDIAPETIAIASTPTHVRGFIAALIEGDRAAVFAGLRQYIRGAGAPEKLIAETACLLDDAYRARLDGTSSDPDTTRLVARLDTPTLEKLVASLTTAIDSSYSAGVTGAKIALTRALAVLGA